MASDWDLGSPEEGGHAQMESMPPSTPSGQDRRVSLDPLSLHGSLSFSGSSLARLHEFLWILSLSLSFYLSLSIFIYVIYIYIDRSLLAKQCRCLVDSFAKLVYRGSGIWALVSEI